MATLDQVTEELQDANEGLDRIDDRFKEFFRQIAADKLDMMEVLRELERKASTSTGKQTTGEPSKMQGAEFAAAFPLLGGLMTFLVGPLSAAFVALQADAMGALGSLKLLADDFKQKIPEAFKSATRTVTNFAKEVKTRIIEIIKLDTDKVPKPETTPSGAKPLKPGEIPTTKSGRQLGEVFTDAAGRTQQIVQTESGTLTSRYVPPDTPSAVPTAPTANESILSKTAQGVMKAGEAAINAIESVPGGKALVKLANKALIPVSVATSAYSGYKLAEETPEMSTTGKAAVFAGGVGSAVVGGIMDLAKTIVLDAPIELGQAMGVLDEKGYAQRIQDVSLQRDLTDEIVRGIRDGVRALAADEVATQSLNNVGSNGGVTVINNNTNAPTTTQNNVNSSGGDAPLPTSTTNNGTLADAYVM